MKCHTCNIIEPYTSRGFTTELDFVKAEDLLKKLSKSNQLVVESTFTYLCMDCNAKWEMSPPDNAFRGWLKYVSPRAQRIQELRSKRTT